MEMIHTVTCHIWHEDEIGCYMVVAADLDGIDAAKDEAKSNALDGFGSDLVEPHRIWFTQVSFPAPVVNEAVVVAELPAIPDEAPITAAIS